MFPSLSQAGEIDCQRLAKSTQLILGTVPALYTPAFQNRRVKQDLLLREKKKAYPFGMDLPGNYDFFWLHVYD